MNRKALFSQMGMSEKDYIVKYALPMIAMGVAFPLIIVLIAPDVAAGPGKIIIILIPLVMLCMAVMYPFSIYNSKKVSIDNHIHYYVTHMGVLSTSQMGRKDLLEKVSKMKSYGSLASETGKVYMLMNDWNLSLAQACRFIARRTPSEIFADFLDRLAHAIDAGEKMEDFLRSEQLVVMNDFETLYKAALHAVDSLNETYISMNMALVFMMCFAIIMPVLTGMDPFMLIGGGVLTFIMAEAAIVFYAKTIVPKDKIWHSLDIPTDAYIKIKRSFPISIALCMIVSVPVVFFMDLPITLLLPIIFTPLVYTGWLANKEENHIKRKDSNFAAFIRSLGSSAGARGGLINKSLYELTFHDFGPLTVDVIQLYKRLNARINKMKSWDYFAAWTGSSLIQRYGTIFAEGTDIGGKPEIIGDIIAANFMRIVSLRKLRYSSSSGFVGSLYGLTAGMAFTLFISISVVEMLGDIFASSDFPAELSFGIHLGGSGMDISMITTLLMVLMMAHSLLSSLLMRIIDGGHFFNIYIHFVGMLWVSGITAIMSVKITESFLVV
jgi:flagellar protein FlaJ